MKKIGLFLLLGVSLSWLRADVAVCWTTEYVYNIMILSSFFYLWKGNWRNKKI